MAGGAWRSTFASRRTRSWAARMPRKSGRLGEKVPPVNRPRETKPGPMYVFGEIESGNRLGAMVVSTVLLACSLGVLIVLNLLQRRGEDRR